MKDADVVSSVGSDANLIFVSNAKRKRTVVRFQDRPSLIHITQRKDSQFSGAAMGTDRNGQRAVEEVHMNLTHGIDLIDAASRPRTEKSDVAFTRVESQPYTIEAPPHSGETEVANQPLGDAGIDKRCDSLVLRRRLRAVKKCETAQTHIAVRRNLEAEVGLLHKAIRIVLSIAVRDVVSTAQAKLALASGNNGGCGKSKNGILSSFQQPFNALPLLADSQAQK